MNTARVGKAEQARPELERVIRKDGVISLWKTQFKPNVGGGDGGDRSEEHTSELQSPDR